MDKAIKMTKKLTAGKVRRSLYDLISDYVSSQIEGKQESFIAEVLSQMQEEMKTVTIEDKSLLVQQVIFLNILGYDTTWADFMVLDVMSLDNYSSKRICYTSASQMWNSSSDVVLMSTNRVHKDLTSTNPLTTSVVLTSVPHYLSEPLAQHVANDIISLMSSSKGIVKQKAITAFYQLCLKYPEALKAGFPVLKTRLEDSDQSVVFAVLSVLSEFVIHNEQMMVPLIPKLHKMLEASNSNWIVLKIIFILRRLCTAEPRLPKKLITPFTTLLETTSSITVLFECVRTIIEVPITNTVLLTYATQRMQNFIEHADPNLRYLCLSLFLKLMEIQPKMVAQHKEIISQCLDSNDEATRILALDLLMALANPKTIDGIVSKMFDHFKDAITPQFKDMIVTRVIEICSKNDYALVSDFDWYINVLGDFVEEGGFTCIEMVSNQFMDLATRVPSTRNSLVSLMCKILEMKNYRDATKLLLCSLYIISEYSENSDALPTILRHSIMFCDERVQVSCLSTAFKLYIRSDNDTALFNAEAMIKEHIGRFETGNYAEVQDIALMTTELMEMLRSIKDTEDFEMFKNRLIEEYDEDSLPELSIPDELKLSDTLFKDSDEEFEDEEKDQNQVEKLVEGTTKEISEGKSQKHRSHRKQVQKVDRSQVVIKSSKKSVVNVVQNSTKADPLSQAFASLDLTENNTPVIPRPQPYSSSQQSTINTPSSEMKAVLRKKAKRPGETEKDAPKSSEPPVNGPLPKSRMQVIAETPAINVFVNEFLCDNENKKQLSIDLEVRNNTEIEIPSCAIELIPTEGISSISIDPIVKPISSKHSIAHTISVEISNPAKPQVIKMRFIPVSNVADVIEASIKIFPSFFLLPGEISSLQEAESSCIFQDEISLKMKTKPRDVLQRLVDVMRGPIIPTSEKTSKKLYSRATTGAMFICFLSVQEEKATIQIRCNDKSSLDLMIKELKIKTNNLSK